MATWVFQVNAPAAFTIANLSGSGLNFWGPAGFSNSVPVSAYQSITTVGNGNGTVNGPLTNNVQYINPASGIVNNASSGIPILNIPNYLSTFIAEFQHPSNVRLQNTRAYLYDRTAITNAPSGLITKFAQVVHPGITITTVGSGHPVWQSPAGSSYMTMAVDSPGRSGLCPNGPSTVDMFHTFNFIISQSPNSTGSKALNAFYIETEYV